MATVVYINQLSVDFLHVRFHWVRNVTLKVFLCWFLFIFQCCVINSSALAYYCPSNGRRASPIIPIGGPLLHFPIVIYPLRAGFTRPYFAYFFFFLLPPPPPISPGSEQHSCISLDTSNWRSAPLPHGKVSASYFRRTESHICIIHPPQYHCHVLERLCSLSNHTFYDSVIVCSYIKPQHPYHHQVGHLFLLESTHLLNIWSVSNFLFRLGPWRAVFHSIFLIYNMNNLLFLEFFSH